MKKKCIINRIEIYREIEVWKGENTIEYGHEEVIGDLWVCRVSVEWQGQKPDCKEGKTEWGGPEVDPSFKTVKIEC